MAVDELAAEIQRRAPGWREAADAAAQDLRDITAVVVAATRTRRGDQALATQAIFVQAVNDFIDLLMDASAGRGRPSLRSARTLFEHQVAALDVAGDRDIAKRWLDHLPMAAAAETQLSLVDQTLKGNPLKAYRHRMKKLAGPSKRLQESAVKRWGATFKRQWHEQNLFDRSKSHGLDDTYDFYRFASAPVHGSHGGLVGLRKEIQGEQVVRVGPALAIAPYAVLYGTASIRTIVEVAAPYVENGLPRTLDALETLDREWGNYYEAVLRFDAELWPDQPPPELSALMIVDAAGAGRWYEYDPATERARPALSPHVVMQPEQEHPLDLVLSSTSGRAIGICVYGAVVNASAEPWVDVSRLLAEAPIAIREDGSVEVAVPPDEE